MPFAFYPIAFELKHPAAFVCLYSYVKTVLLCEVKQKRQKNSQSLHQQADGFILLVDSQQLIQLQRLHE
jgi:hypothetical protein